MEFSNLKKHFEFLFSGFLEDKDKSILYRPKTPFWVAGGCFAAILDGRKVKDYDIFTPNPLALCYEIDNQIENGDTHLVHGKENDWIKNYHFKDKTIQVIKRYKFESPEATIKNFDFTIVCAAYDGENFFHHERFYLDVAQKRLVINELPKPLSTMQRALRYTRRGYTMCPIGLGKIMRQINSMRIDWDNPNENEIEFYPDGTPKFNGID